MQTILNKVLLEYANTLEIDYIDNRTAKIKFLERSSKDELGDKLSNVYLWDRDYQFQRIGYSSDENFNSNGKETTAIVRLKKESKPFYVEKGEIWVRDILDFKKIVISNKINAYSLFYNLKYHIIEPKKVPILRIKLKKIIGSGETEKEAWANAHKNLFPKYWEQPIQPPIYEK